MSDYQQHGGRHGTGGSDRRGGGYPAYEWDNIGDWLYIRTTETSDDGSLSWDAIRATIDGNGLAIISASDGVDGFATLEVIGGDGFTNQDNVNVGFGGNSDGAPFFLSGSDYLHALVHSHLILDVFGTGGDAGNGSELIMSLGEVTLVGNQGVDIISNAALDISPFPVGFGDNSVQIAAGDATNHGIVVLEAFDNQATPTYTEFFAGYVDFAPNPYAYNGQTAQILGGQTFTVVGSDGSPIFQVEALEQGGSVHIKTGGTVVADL